MTENRKPCTVNDAPFTLTPAAIARIETLCASYNLTWVWIPTFAGVTAWVGNT